MDITELIDRAKTRSNLGSNYALAKAMGIQPGIIYSWIKGKRHPSNEEAVQMATLAGIDEMQVIAAIELATAKNEQKKEFWRHFLKTKGVTATVTLTSLGIALLCNPEQGNAEYLHNSLQSEVQKDISLNNKEFTLAKTTLYTLCEVRHHPSSTPFGLTGGFSCPCSSFPFTTCPGILPRKINRHGGALITGRAALCKPKNSATS